MDIFAYVTSLSCHLKLQRWSVCSRRKTDPHLKPHTITSGYTVEMDEKMLVLWVTVSFIKDKRPRAVCVNGDKSQKHDVKQKEQITEDDHIV